MLQLTVDLTMDKSLLVKAATFILQFAGYTPPNTAVPQDTLSAAVQAPQTVSHADALIAREKQAAQQELRERRDAAKALSVAAPAPDSTDGWPKVPEPAAVFAPSVPTPPTPPAPPAPAGIDVDKSGLPWDARIHSSTRAKNADGTWRQKRGVDPQLLTTVEAELRHTMSVPAAPSVPVVPPPPFAGNAAPPAPPAASGTPPVPVSAGAATTASPGSVTNGAAPSDITFAQLMPKITQGFTAGTLTKPAIDAALAKVGLSMVPQLALRPDLVGAVATELGIAL